MCGSLALTLGALAAASCTDEKTVFVERELFDEPLPAAAGMLGYSNSETNLTTCGNCHVGPQSQWEETAHADAWAGLQDSGHAQEFCEGCHTVSELGNELVELAGYTATGEERYHDVQCESCHGPGLTHVQAPNSQNVPLAPATVGLDFTTGCGECHSDTHHPFVEDWSQSAHANPSQSAMTRDGCNGCHSGNGSMERFGVELAYAEAGEAFPITCVACHDPHGSDNAAQLRFPVSTANVEDNLCSRCHDRRTVPDPGSSHGLHPHSPETALITGEAGWFPPGVIIERGEIIATHGSEANENLCATCHVSSFDVTDSETGDFLITATGHVFNAIPCTNENGQPIGGDCELSQDARTLEGCTGAGCHGTGAAAFGALTSAATRLEFLAEELHELLEIVDPNLEDEGGEIDARNPTFTVAEGAFFNYALAEFGGLDRPDELLAFTGAATHNPFLVEQLLIASIRAVENEYGVSPPPSLNLERQIRVDGMR